MHRLPGLDLLRAIAIIWVMLFHSYMVGGLADPFFQVQRYGWMGVDLFFVLSGYLIGAQLLKPLRRGEPLGFGRFYLSRTLRVVPAYLMVLVLYFAVPGCREADGIQPLWQFLTYAVNFLIDYEHNQAFSHVWSLCVEEHFYLVFPLLAWWLTRRPTTGKFIGLCIAIVVGGMIVRGYSWQHMGAHFVEDIYYPTYNRLDGLLAGVVLATIQVFRPTTWQWLQEKSNILLLPLGIVLLAAAIGLFGNRTGLAPTIVGYPLLSWGMALIVAAAAAPQSYLARLRIPGVEWIALISYSLYLIHKIVFHLVDGLLSERLEQHAVITFAAYAAATLAAGAALHYGVERPFLRLRDRLRIGHTQCKKSRDTFEPSPTVS